MKKFLILLSILCCGIAAAHTINWRVDGNIYQTTTCDSGESITPPTPPYKYGYHFKKWGTLYTAVEYLESTGTQYIDTGVYGGFITKARIAPKTINNKYVLQLGSISKTISPDNSRNEIISINSLLYAEKGNICNVANIPITDNTPFDLYLDTSNTKFLVKINNVTYIDRNNTNILPAQDVSIKIGYSDYTKNAYPQKNYYVKIWDSNNTLVRDFIPVLDEDGVPCMYDRVEKKYYYNAGTGQFIAGPVLQ